MINIQTLEQRIKDRAHSESCNEAQIAVNSIPHFDKIKLCIDNDSKPPKYKEFDSYHLRIALQKAIQEQIYASRVNELSKKLLSAVDQIEEFSAVVDNLQAQS